MRRPRRVCIICGNRRAVDDTGWCDACHGEAEDGVKMDKDGWQGSILPDDMTNKD